MVREYVRMEIKHENKEYRIQEMEYGISGSRRFRHLQLTTYDFCSGTLPFKGGSAVSALPG